MKESLTESQNLDEVRRISWRDAQKILKICGYEQQEYAKLVELTPSGFSTNIWSKGTDKISLKRMDALRNMVGERNYNLALAEIRREEEEKAQRLSKK